MEKEYIEAGIKGLAPVMEGAMIFAGEYCKACGRHTMTSVDLQYALRFSARNVTGKYTNASPEMEKLIEAARNGYVTDTDSDSDSDSDIEEVDEDDEPFTRYSGDDELMNLINHSYDTWDEWETASPLEKMLKDAIDKIG